MRTPGRSFALLLTLGSLTLAHALTTDEQAVVAPFQRVLDGIAQRNHDLVRQQLLPGGMITLIRDGKAVQLHFDAFVERLPTTGSSRLEETIDKPIVHIDDNIAVLWAPYVFRIDGKVDHCGTDTATFFRSNGKWLISGISDNTHKDCGAAK